MFGPPDLLRQKSPSKVVCFLHDVSGIQGRWGGSTIESDSSPALGTFCFFREEIMKLSLSSLETESIISTHCMEVSSFVCGKGNSGHNGDIRFLEDVTIFFWQIYPCHLAWRGIHLALNFDTLESNCLWLFSGRMQSRRCTVSLLLNSPSLTSSRKEDTQWSPMYSPGGSNVFSRIWQAFEFSLFIGMRLSNNFDQKDAKDSC